MTLYTRIVDFSLLYEVWEIFLFERDKYMIFYFAVAVMIVHREQILQLNSMEQLLHYLQSITLENYALLAEAYFHAIQCRRNTPASFQIIVQRLGIFEYNPIISNEELEKIESFNLTEWMPVLVKEIVLGSQATLAQQSKMADNNNKYRNLLLLREDDQQVYVCPSASSPSVKDNETLTSVTNKSAAQTLESQSNHHSVPLSNPSKASSGNEQHEKRLLAEFKRNSLKPAMAQMAQL